MHPHGFLQVDVDGLWAVRACYGKPEGDTHRVDPCWMEGVPRLAKVFGEVGTPAGFFIVGRDLEIASKREAASALLHAGHELGNHSYSHRIGLTREPHGFIHDELFRTHEALVALGADPVGFRAPGYDVDARVLRVVRRLRYLYDASILPTYLAPVLRVADAFLARRVDFTKRQFGRFSYGRAPRNPYFPLPHAIRKPARSFAQSRLLEIPVGVTPTLRMPLTAASLLPLSRSRLRELFTHLARRRHAVLLLLHAIDGTDCRQPIVFDTRRPSLGGFAMSGEEKERRLRRIVEEFARQFAVVRADDYARARCSR